MSEKLTEWLENFRWAMNAMRARRFRKQLGFARRVAFDNALRQGPSLKQPAIAYPDALYHITVDDVIRAMEAAAAEKTP